MDNKNIFSIVVVLLLVSFGLIYYFYDYRRAPSQNAVCTLEAKICPDGSSVGRVGPLCEFAQCPGNDSMTNYQYATDTDSGVVFSYPLTLSTNYIEFVDWPPKIQIDDNAFECTPAGDEFNQAGMTKLETIDGRRYCVTRESEGAAGSIYTNYAYKVEKDEKVYIITFSMRAPQCANYESDQQTACEDEESVFNPGLVVDKIVNTI